MGFREGLGVCHDLLYKGGIFGFFLDFRLRLVRGSGFLGLLRLLYHVRDRRHLQVIVTEISSQQAGKFFPPDVPAEKREVLVLHQNTGLANFLHHKGLAVFQIHHIPRRTRALGGSVSGRQFSLLLPILLLRSSNQTIKSQVGQFMGNQFCCAAVLRR